jgi:hypothetical protein
MLLVCLAGAASAQVMTYETVSDWSTGFSGRITIKNDTKDAIRNWTLEFDFDRALDTIWDARIMQRAGNRYVVINGGWNSEILPGATTSFGFGGSPGNVSAGPSNYKMGASTGSVGSAEAGKVKVTIRQTSRWEGGFGANIILLNQGAAEVQGWNLRFTLDATINTLWNAAMTREGSVYTLVNDGSTGTIGAGGAALVGFSATGSLRADSASGCEFNGAPCTLEVDTATTTPAAPRSRITVKEVDTDGEAIQVTVAQGTSTYALEMAGASDAAFTVVSNNLSVVTAAIDDRNQLRLEAKSAGRAAIRITDPASGSTRYLGVRARNADGSLPGMPSYLSLGSVSEDSEDHLGFWRAFEEGPKNKRVDIRYIYLNGGPLRGWDTWGDAPGSRAVRFIRNSRLFGMIPFFVFYNIPDDSESYALDLAHVQDRTYLIAYFRNLKLTLDIINQESPDDTVGILLEPDFLGYLAQNAAKPASAIAAATRAAYDSGVLSTAEDPAFPDTVQGLVRAINYTISKYTPQVVFGWQVNLWASPPGGYTTPIPINGLIHKTDTEGIEKGRQQVASEASAITNYYVAAGVTSHGASFISIDKYGLDAVGAEAHAQNDPARSIWFWNNDHWTSYLVFVQSMHRVSGLPVILWQLPVGRINSTLESNPYAASGRFADLPNRERGYEDSAPVFFFGDSFPASGARLAHFGANLGSDPSLSVRDGVITWGAHMAQAAEAGVVSMMFGPGVGAATSNLGSPPTDNYWWITKAQKYLDRPVPLKK